MRYSLLYFLLIQSVGFSETTQAWKTKREELVTISGTVLRTDRLPESDGKEVGAEIQLKTQEGVLNVHVGPMWYSAVRNSAPQIGDPLTVVGIRMSFDKKPDLVAKEVQINGKKFTVWEKEGRSLSDRKVGSEAK